MKIKKNGAWEDFILPVSVPTMKGASDTSDGTKGLVPAPAAGMQNKFLCSDATWKDAGGLPVGHEFFTTNPNIPAGCIPLLGGEYSRTAYADLWAWVQTQQGYLIEESAWQAKAAANSGNVPFYSKGDGSTNFRVPSLKCWVKGANGIEEVGSYLSAGLPNITGAFTKGPINDSNNKNGWAQTDSIGAFKARNVRTRTSFTESSDSYNVGNGFDFDASLSNPIYGSSSTVQPPSIVGMWLVKAYGTVTNVGSTDVANIAQGLTELETRVIPISQGGTGATTAIDASKNLMKDGFELISENADLNNYKTPGLYICKSNSIVATLSNCPTETAFIMKITGDTSDWIKQELSLYNSVSIYTRDYHTWDPSGWSSWQGFWIA